MKTKLVMVSVQSSPGVYRTYFLALPVSDDGKVRIPFGTLSRL